MNTPCRMSQTLPAKCTYQADHENTSSGLLPQASSLTPSHTGDYKSDPFISDRMRKFMATLNI